MQKLFGTLRGHDGGISFRWELSRGILYLGLPLGVGTFTEQAELI